MAGQVPTAASAPQRGSALPRALAAGLGWPAGDSAPEISGEMLPSRTAPERDSLRRGPWETGLVPLTPSATLVKSPKGGLSSEPTRTNSPCGVGLPWRASGGCPRPARRGLGHALSCSFSPDSLRAPGDDRQAPPWGGDIVQSHNSHLGVPGGSLVGSPRVSGPKVRAAGEAGEGGEFSLKPFFCYFPLTTDTQHSLGCGCPAQ